MSKPLHEAMQEADDAWRAFKQELADILWRDRYWLTRYMLCIYAVVGLCVLAFVA